ncbi:MoaD/ThiS family protein [Corynebacterium diphtheriae bv. mitis]|uniref:MoaD/ThiS family protein n=1 Tax=Corynebacterium diphtheriae TaxID=1717 RepID=A0A811FZ97_CORDP|nr:MoaD/ThiS family protein [Corynebacterium diphtheriae]OWN09098.1 molybdopterin synthase sulfur carrier subunit [Corynebacterium belfantii]AEX69144.1 hypothetical protein CDPW8_0482 [Corynebacterium diphtheriae PW8]KLN42001.1 molybdopterin biosynthesis protein MoaD2 [Corynebacterium diphtheriae bv. gravis str. ISS 4060]MBG9222682.1 MoaD/ThiS family protein [Corynebacterium diphtheriae bv. mitis]MBG9264165.1 MoaD/ThiS family protein [Corynebacterium diphtheriae bv. gravis]
MEIHYYAAARAARGEEIDNVDIAQYPDMKTLADLVGYLTRQYGELCAGGVNLGYVLQRSTFLTDGQSAHHDTNIRKTQRVDILPPFAGG